MRDLYRSRCSPSFFLWHCSPSFFLWHSQRECGITNVMKDNLINRDADKEGMLNDNIYICRSVVLVIQCDMHLNRPFEALRMN